MPKDVTVVEGEKLKLECDVHSPAPRSISWTVGKYPFIHFKSNSMAVCHRVKLAYIWFKRVYSRCYKYWMSVTRSDLAVIFATVQVQFDSWGGGLQRFNLLMPNNHYSGRTAPLTSKRCILYIYSTNTGTEYFKHGIYSPFFPLQNAVCFIVLTYLVPLLFTFYIQGVLKLKK